MTDPDSYRIIKVNRELHRVYKGDVLVGQVRYGLDKKWYAELPATQFMTGAVHQLIVAHEAIGEFTDAVNG